MTRFVPYIVKTLWRHRSRTMLTVVGSAVALFVFCFVGAVQEGMNDLQKRQAGNRALVVFQANKFCPATSQLPEHYQEKIEIAEQELAGLKKQISSNESNVMLQAEIDSLEKLKDDCIQKEKYGDAGKYKGQIDALQKELRLLGG